MRKITEKIGFFFKPELDRWYSVTITKKKFRNKYKIKMKKKEV